MKKMKFILFLQFVLTNLYFLNAQAPPQYEVPHDTINTGGCGTDGEFILQQQLKYVTAISNPKPPKIIPGENPMALFVPQGSFPVGLIENCGTHFRIYYEDYLYLPAEGFADPSFGAARRNTLCRVLQDFESRINIPAGVTIDLFIDRSYSTSFPAPGGTGFLAAAGPYFPPTSGFPGTPGIYAGNMFNHITGGVDPDPANYDSHIHVNFDKLTVGPPVSIFYWDDYANTAVTCRHDLYSVLLHEVTHTLGWFSNVTETLSGTFPAQNTTGYNNAYSLYDWMFLYHGDPVTSVFNKVVIGTTTSPSINAAVNAFPSPLRSNKIWQYNNGAPLNQPVYSGIQPTSPATYLQKSIMSHLNYYLYGFNAMGQDSPGLRLPYVIGPVFSVEEMRRDWTLPEYRTLLQMGYLLNPTFASSNSLNGIDPNINLIQSNIPPGRNPATDITAFNSYVFPETTTPDFSLVNNNTPSTPGASSILINLSADPNIFDGNPLDQISVQPNSLFGIRGCSDNGNNHNRVVVSPSGTQITYTPEPGYFGKAQFGFHLWDGHEKGALKIYTINVLSGTYVPSIGTNLVVNGSFEDGTEVKQMPGLTSKPYTGSLQKVDGEYMTGNHLAGGHPYSFMTNYWTMAGGDVVLNSEKTCSMVSSFKGFFGAAMSSVDPVVTSYRPLPNAVTVPNERYHFFNDVVNFSQLIVPTQNCKSYTFEFDINLQNTGAVVGGSFPLTLQFINDPGSTPLSLTVIQSVPVNITVATVAPNSWQHASVTFSYCGAGTRFLNLALPAGFGYLNSPYIDNISLKENAVASFPVTITPSNQYICLGSTATLTANAISCDVTYLWQPGGATTATINVSPGITTTYTVTATNSCGTSSTATSTVFVTSSQCCLAATLPPIPNGANSGTIFPSGTVSGATVDVLGVFNINSNLTISNCKFRMAPNAKIIVQAPNTLTINMISHLFACSDMWGGIEVQPGATLVVTGNTLIEDALNAVVAQSGGASISDYKLTNVVFNKNKISILVQPSLLTAQTGYVRNCVFTCRDIHTVPPILLISTLKPANALNPYPKVNLFNPHGSIRSVAAMDITDNLLVNFGTAAGIQGNTVDNMDYGVFARNSNFNVYHNVFENLTGQIPICPHGGPCPPPTGIAVYAIDGSFVASNPATYNTMNVGGSAPLQANTILQCLRGVDVTDYVSMTVQGNTFSNTAAIFFPFGGSNQVGDHAVFIQNQYSQLFEVDDNAINNYVTGIHFIRTGTSLSLASNQNILRNNISSLNANSTSNTGIFVEDVVSPQFLNTTFGIVIQENEVYETNTCIRARNVTGGNNTPGGLKIIDNTPLSIRPSGPTTVTNKAGIRIESCRSAIVYLNQNINGSTTTLTNTRVKGIYITKSPGSSVTCNRIYDVGQSMVFEGGCTGSTVKRNRMEDANDGFVLLTNGLIGPQGAVGQPSDNSWFGTFVNSRTLTFNTFAPNTHSPLYVRPGAPYKPAFATNKNVGGTPAVDSYNVPGALVTTSGIFVFCAPIVHISTTFSNEVRKQIVQDLITFVPFEPETKRLSKQDVFADLREDAVLLVGEPILQNFYTLNETSNIGKIDKVIRSVQQGDLSLANSTNMSIAAASTMEENHKSFNEIYLNTIAIGASSISSTELDGLNEIAIQCPLTGGDAVNQARSALNYMYHGTIDFEDTCIVEESRFMNIAEAIEEMSEANTNEFKLYPNPSDGTLILEYVVTETEVAQLLIYDISGKLLRDYTLNSNNTKLSIADVTLENGIYFYTIVVNGHISKSDKLVIVK